MSTPRKATRNDVATKIAKFGKCWGVFVGDRTDPVYDAKRKRDAQEYVDTRSASDRAITRAIDTADRAQSGIAHHRAQAHVTPVEYVGECAGMRVETRELRDAGTGARIWEVTLQSNHVGYLIEHSPGVVSATIDAPRHWQTTVSCIPLNRGAIMLCEQRLQDVYFGRTN